MGASQTVKVAKDGQIKLYDGTSPTSLSHTVSYEDGDFSLTPEPAERVVIRDRGAIVGVRSGDDVVGTFSMSCYMREFTDGSDTTIIDAIEKTGGASAWVSTGGTGYTPYLLDVEFIAEGSDHGDDGDHKVMLTKCHLTWDFAEGKDGNKINISGEIYGTITRSEP